MTETIEVDAVFGRIESFVDDLITDQILEFGAHTRPDLALLLSILESGDFVFDIGAHIGAFAAPIARKVGVSGKVLATEALTTNYEVLTRNMARLGLQDRVYAVCATIGVSATACRPQFVTRNTGATYLVPKSDGSQESTKTLDDLASQTFFPRVVKLDIEGLELAALRGASNVLDQQPILYVELNQDALARNGDSIEALDAFLSKRGYKFFRNVGARNAAHDNYVIREIDRLIDGGRFYDVLAIPLSDERINQAIGEARKLSTTEYMDLFDRHISDLPTHAYLRDHQLVRYLDSVIVPRRRGDTAETKAALQLGTAARSRWPGVRVALCNVALDGYAGSELWVSISRNT